jgi:hypothetical protein
MIGPEHLALIVQENQSLAGFRNDRNGTAT